jgi:hypothetical protein
MLILQVTIASSRLMDTTIEHLVGTSNWLSKALTDHAVAVIIKREAQLAGPPTPELSGHLPRSGSVTE